MNCAPPPSRTSGADGCQAPASNALLPFRQRASRRLPIAARPGRAQNLKLRERPRSGLHGLPVPESDARGPEGEYARFEW
jgi:hypothetical protein